MSLVIREIQSALCNGDLRKWKITTIDEYMEKLEPKYTADGNIKWYSCCGVKKKKGIK